jgi:hypothetical protein
MPFTHSDAPPSAAAARIGSIDSSGSTPVGNWRNTGLLATTLMPARSSRHRSSTASCNRLSAMAV